MQSGKYQHKACIYGYKKGLDGRLEIDKIAAETVKLIYSLALESKSPLDIVKALYERKVPTPGEYSASKGLKGGSYDLSRSRSIWSGEAIKNVLREERYTGTYIAGKYETKEVGGKGRLADESKWVKIPDHHPAIISKETFEQVQVLRFRAGCKPRQSTPRQYALKGKIFCGCCGHALDRSNGKKSPSFSCYYSRAVKEADCNALKVNENEIEIFLFDVISKQAQVIIGIDSLGNMADLPLRTEQQVEYEKRIEECKELKCSLYEKYVLGDIGEDAYKAEKANIDTELAQLNRIYETVKAENATMLAAKTSDTKRRTIAESVTEIGKLNRQLVDLLIDKVLVYPGNRVDVVWKVEDFVSAKI